MQGRKLLMQGGQWAVKRRGRCKRSTTVEKWMCRLRRNELYRLKFRKKFVKNGQEEIYAREGGGREGGDIHEGARVWVRKSTFTNDPLHLSPPWDMSYDWEPRKKICCIALLLLLPLSISLIESCSFFFCKLTRFSGAFFRLFPRCLIRGQTMIHFCTSS